MKTFIAIEIYFRANSESASIDYRGYLLKRSNLPIRNWQALNKNNFPLNQRHKNQENTSVFDENSCSAQDSTGSVISAVQYEEDVVDLQEENSSLCESNNISRSDSMENSTENRTIDQLSRFFGIQVSKAEKSIDVASNLSYTQPDLSEKSRISKSTLCTPTKTATKSIPIQSNEESIKVQNSWHHRNSVPISRNKSPPSDWINPDDGHIWRAKYCVLLDGYLYFYRSKEDGESWEASRERSHKDSTLRVGESSDLSKSPLPRNFMKSTLATSSSIYENNAPHEIWEKRVTLRDVVAVRSAEIRYGDYAFELQAETGDRLILRAENSTSLKEWLFQFHRSLSSFIREYVYIVDLHLSSKYNDNPNPENDISSLDFLPRKSPSLALSVPHGSGLHRRRKNEVEEDSTKLKNKPANFTQVKTSPNGGESIDHSESCVQPIVIENQMNITPVKEKKSGKYIPPQLRKRLEEEAKRGINPSEAKTELCSDCTQPKSITADSNKVVVKSRFTSQHPEGIFRGGCADPSVVNGSILDHEYKEGKSSLVTASPTQAYGCYGGGSRTENHQSTLYWEVGAKNVCGVRTSNEDAFFICHDASKVFQDDTNNLNGGWGKHEPGMFGIFDGHCGNEAARFATERLVEYFFHEWKQLTPEQPDRVKTAMQRALDSLDHDFCQLCVEDGRTWESGSTAIIATIVDGELFVTNLGDCRAVMCRSVTLDSNSNTDSALHRDGWTLLQKYDDSSEHCDRVASDECNGLSESHYRGSYWKEVSEVHTLAREDEKQRITEANGWITTELDVQYGQMHRIDFHDSNALDILRRSLSEQNYQSQTSQQKKNSSMPKMVHIERVCGDLAVTRAIGDRLFKARFNTESTDSSIPPEEKWWICPQSIPLPKDHSGRFKGDLVSSQAETRVYKIVHENDIDQFLVLACDGFWDVIDPDEAVRLTRELLYKTKSSAKNTAERLAELAIHLGSSDNITVIIIRFFCASSMEIKELKSKNDILS
jgi:serine/threonine protein phosphatase PrpC